MERDKRGFPVAYCYRDGVHWVVPVCPLCKRKHLHGYAGGVDGHRVAHCPPGTPGAERGYTLEVAPGLVGPSPPLR